MAHDGCMVREVTKLVGLDQKLLYALVAVGGVVLVDGARTALDPVLAERVGATEGVGFGRGAIHEKVPLPSHRKS
jgi:hypothetical protein